jgi:thiol-disulfide isomerase/thioredoxin
MPADKFNFAFLYEATPNGANYVDRARLDSIGQFKLTLEPELKPGIYKIVYAIPPEENNFDFIYNGSEDIAFEFNLNSGVKFIESSENKMWLSYLNSMEMINQTINNYYQKDGKDINTFNDIFKTLKDTQDAYDSSSQDMMVSTFIRSNKPYIPDSYEDVSTYAEGLKNNYFKAVDFDNALLQSSTFIADRINNYVFAIANKPSNEIYKQQVADVAEVIASSSIKTQLSIFQMLWEEFLQLKNEEMALHVGQTFLKPMAEKENNTDLLNQLEAQKNLSLGAIAPDFEISNSPEPQFLSDLKGNDYYLIVFWSSGCSHCLKEVPQLHELLKSKPQIKVVAYGLEDNRQQWENTISTLKDFIHVYGNKKWDNPLVRKYDLSATPTYFLLDKDKAIIAKPYSYEDLESAIQDL